MGAGARISLTWSCVAVAAISVAGDAARGQGLRWSTTTVFPGSYPYGLHTHDDGSGLALYICGAFDQGVMRWDGTTLSSVGGGVGYGWNGFGSVNALASYRSPSELKLVVGGEFVSAGGIPAQNLAAWNGSSWTSIDGIYGGVACFAVDGPLLYVGGRFQCASNPTSHNFARWNGTIWQNIGAIGAGEPDADVLALAWFDDGHGSALYAGGLFTNAGGVAVRNMAKWDGSTWSPVGTPSQNGVRGEIDCMTVFDDGSGPALFVGGVVHRAGGIAASNIAKWDGAQWSTVGTGLPGFVFVLTSFDDGTGPALYAGGGGYIAGGSFHTLLAKWDGRTWSQLGSGVGGTNSAYVSALCPFTSPAHGRELYVGGFFSMVGGLPSSDLAGWQALPGPISTFCFGDRSVAHCPCAHPGIPDHGCDNSLRNGGAWLEATGSANPDTLQIHVAGELSTATSIVLQGDELILATNPYGDGLRCVGGHLKRLYTRSAVGGRINVPGPGDPSITARSAALGDPIAPGSSRCYQVYYRDPDPNFCPPPSGDAFNTTNALRVVW